MTIFAVSPAPSAKPAIAPGRRHCTRAAPIDAGEGLIQDVGIGLVEGRFPIASAESGALLMLGITQAALVQTLELADRFSVVAGAQQLGAMLLRGLGLPHAEAEMIAAQETDSVIRAQHVRRP